MTIILIFGVAAGAILAVGRFKVLALLPVILIVAVGAIANGFAIGLDPRIIGWALLAAIVSPQIGYLVASVGVSYVVGEYLRLRANGNRPALLRAMQTEIGQELRTAYELPRELPPEMIALLAQMNEK